MDSETRGRVLVRWGAICLVISAILLCSWNVFAALAGRPPSKGEEMTAWINGNSTTIAFSNEALSFATYFLMAGCVGLWYRLWTRTEHPILTILGFTGVALSVMNLSMMNIFLGRLVYPVFGLVPPNEALASWVSAYYGGFHVFDLLWVPSSILLALARQQARPSPTFLVFSVVVAVAELLAAYPWLFSAEVVFLLRLPLHLWLAVVGLEMFRQTNPKPLAG